MSGHDDGLDLAQLRAALMQLVQLATARRLRQDDPPDASSIFTSRMREVLAGEQPVVLQIQSDGMLCEDTKMVGEDLLSQHLCRVLAGAGLRAMFIEPSATDAELGRLIDLLARDWESRAVFEADLPTAAWQARFLAVHLDMAAVALTSDEQGDDDALVIALQRQLASPGLALEGELGVLLGMLRGAESRSKSWDAYSEESTGMLSHPRASEALHRELERIRADKDVSHAQIGAIALEALRQAHSVAVVQLLARQLIEHTIQAFAAGRPEESAFLHGPLSLLDASLFSRWPYRAELSEALRGLGAAAMWDAVLEGLEHQPEPGPWLGPLFTLAASTPADEAGRLAQHAARLSQRALRQAVADGLALGQIRAGSEPSALLSLAPPEAWTVALLAMSRSTDATVLAQVLARAGSDDADIREAVLVAVRRQQSPRIKGIAREALADRAESVRLEALRYLAVYRDTDGGERIAAALGVVVPGSRSPGELVAMAKALVVIQGSRAVAPLQKLAMRPELSESDPDLTDAVLVGLFAAGRDGAAALDALGLARPPLRSKIRTLLGS
ncbi:MAG: hypothetical protein ACI8S6_001770 [Myxococcota bacterium]